MGGLAVAQLQARKDSDGFQLSLDCGQVDESRYPLRIEIKPGADEPCRAPALNRALIEAVVAVMQQRREVVAGGSDQRILKIDDAHLVRIGVQEVAAVPVAVHTALRLFDQVAAKWSLGEDERRILVWAARVHELGLAIAHSQYHVHGAYILEHSDIAGFSRQEQLFLAALVRNHRRNVSNKSLEALPDRLLAQARRCAAVLRLAVLLHRSHEAESIPKLEVRASGNAIVLSLSKSWLDERPLLRSDLEHEPEGIAGLAIDLFIED